MDQELFSELKEDSIQTSLISFQPPRPKCFDPSFYLDINGNLLWAWRDMSPVQITVTLEKTLLALGYTLKKQCLSRIVHRVYERKWSLAQFVRTLTNENRRKQEKEKQFSFAVSEEDVDLMPTEVVGQLMQRVKELEAENAELTAKLDDQAGELYAAMEEVKNLIKSGENPGKPFHQVGPKQQQRNLKTIRYTLNLRM